MKTKHINFLKYFMLIYLVISVVILITYSSYKLYFDGLFGMDLCFEFGCLATFFNSLVGLIDIIDFLLKAIVAIVTISGVYFALVTYANNIQTSRINIHLVHLATFKKYISFELENNKQLSANSFNIFKWYNLIFTNSRLGSIDISEAYVKIINDFNNAIKESNDAFKKPNFSYQKHQSRMILNFKKLGITITRMPRNDFYEIEKNILELIERTNEEYCLMQGQGKLIKRIYR